MRTWCLAHDNGSHCAKIYICHALEEYGCFLATYDKVSFELSHAIFRSLEELFGLPTEAKVQNSSDKPYYGYFGQIPDLPLLESLGIGDATTLEGIASFSKLMWPSGNDYFCEIIHQYTNLLSKLEQIVGRMVYESYGVEKHYNTHMESTTHLLRLAKYRVPRVDESNIGGYAHTDKSFITILHKNQFNGLEVRTKNGEWIEVDFLPGSFVIMAGDAFLAWYNYIRDELVDEKYPRRFKPFDHFGILDFFAKHVDHQSVSTAKAYCGV